ncbi:MAG TPA: GTPase ObgE [Dehalococcoidia bacterium]|nr:GTPase ObgE [Dehalococcoidia bacterium]
MIDRADIKLRAGDGGHGLISFHREKFVPRGGPDGGDGGRGGNIVLVATTGVHGLGLYRHRKQFQAERGGNGAADKKHGRNGPDLLLQVPPGTIAVRRLSGEVIADLAREGDRVVVARGGRGGRGNTHFASPSNQAPHISETGQHGEALEIALELKLLSDVGLVGLPNAGKSTLLGSVSRAAPKVADYPFTTLEPVLGVVEVGFDSYVMADLPGLIEGAHRGAGLGLEFLRHVERTRLLVHVVDASQPDVARAIDVIDGELRSYTPPLDGRPQIIAFNKMDVPEAAAARGELEALALRLGRECVFISAAARLGTAELAKMAFEQLRRLDEAAPSKAPAGDEVPVLRPRPRQSRFTIEREDSAYRVVGDEPVVLVEMLALQSDESRAEAMRRLGRMGVVAALRRAGVRDGDPVRFGDIELRWEA